MLIRFIFIVIRLIYIELRNVIIKGLKNKTVITERIKGICQQRLQEMARNVLNSRFSFARNLILAENTQFRSSPLLVAAKRCASVSRRLKNLTQFLRQKMT